MMQNQIFPKGKLGSPAAKGDPREQKKRGARICSPPPVMLSQLSPVYIIFRCEGTKYTKLNAQTVLRVQDVHYEDQNNVGIPPEDVLR